MRPRLLDLFCGAGGAGAGYHRAGFEVVGVDLKPQPHYPFGLIAGDALELLAPDSHLWDWGPFSAIHASPPCQAFTAYRRKGHGVGDGYPDLIADVRELLWNTGLPWVIENVEGSPLREPLLLCGSMWDETLDIRRHRLFESDWPMDDPMWPCRHKLQAAKRFPGGRSTEQGPDNRHPARMTVEVGTWDIPLELQKRAMGVDWDVTLEELSEMVPPAYTEFLGAQLLAHVVTEASDQAASL